MTQRILFLAALVLAAAALVAAASTTSSPSTVPIATPAVAPTPVAAPALDIPEMSSIAAIVALTLTLVGGIKLWLAGVPVLKNIPLPIIVVAVAVGLTAAARYGLHTMTGNGIALCFEAAIAAGAASGIREWYSSITTTMASKAADATTTPQSPTP